MREETWYKKEIIIKNSELILKNLVLYAKIDLEAMYLVTHTIGRRVMFCINECQSIQK